jgi:hypothetical protein
VDLDAALIEAYRKLSELREERPAARFIARPPIPAVLSESLVGHAARWLFGYACRAGFGVGQADLIVHRRVGDPLLVEVKATGASAFQEVKPRDLAADVLVWVDFGNRYVDGCGPTRIYVLAEPGRFEPPTTRSGMVKRKFELKDFLAIANALPGFSSWRYVDIGALAAGASLKLSHHPRSAPRQLACLLIRRNMSLPRFPFSAQVTGRMLVPGRSC